MQKTGKILTLIGISWTLVYGVAYAGLASTATDAEVTAFLKSNASMWLAADDSGDFTLNANGGVTIWTNKADKRSDYGDATAYTVPSHSAAFATRKLVNGRMAVDMGVVNSGIDFCWKLGANEKRMEKVRTVFLAAAIAQSLQAFWIGDTETYIFHRGEQGQYAAVYGKINGARIDGTAVANVTTDKPPTDFHVYTITSSAAGQSNRMTLDRNCNTYNRHGGRQLSELIVFEGDATLDAATIAAVERYLMDKWTAHDWPRTAQWKGGTGVWSAADGWDGTTWRAAANAVFPTADSAVTVDQAATAETVYAQADASVAHAEGAELTTTYVGARAETTLTFDFMPAFAAGYQQIGEGAVKFNCGARTNYTGMAGVCAGTLDLGGGAMVITNQPTIEGTFTLQNGFWDLLGQTVRFRPKANSHVVYGAGASFLSGGDIFPDNGNVTIELLEDCGVIETRGDCVGVTVDLATSNTLIVAGGTLKAPGHRIKIFTQNHGGTGVMYMRGGRVEAAQLRVAASWNSNESVNGTGIVEMTGGEIVLTDEVQIGANNGTHGKAIVHFGGGRVVTPNGLHMYYNDTDTVRFDGTTFVATKDNANYFNFAKATSANVKVEDGGLILDDAGYTLGVNLGAEKVGGTGPVIKRGTGTLVLADAVNTNLTLRVESGRVQLNDEHGGPRMKVIELADGTSLTYGLTFGAAVQQPIADKLVVPSDGAVTLKLSCTDMVPMGTYTLAKEIVGDASNVTLVVEGTTAGHVEANLGAVDGVFHLNVTKSDNPGGELVWAPTGNATWSATVPAWRRKGGDTTDYAFFPSLPLWFEADAANQNVTLAETVKPADIHFTGGVYTLAGGGKVEGNHPIYVEGGATVVNSGVLLDAQPLVITNGVFKMGAGTSGVLGATTVPITIKDKGQFDLNRAADNTTWSATTAAQTLQIEGAGPDGTGALINNGVHAAWRGDAPAMTLTGNMTFGGRNGYRMQKPVNGAGYDVTIAAPDNGTITDLLFDKNNGFGICLDGPKLTANKLTVEKNAYFTFIHNNTVLSLTEGLYLKPGGYFGVWDTTAHVTPNIVVDAVDGDTTPAVIGTGWKTGLFDGTVTVRSGATLQLGHNGNHGGRFDDPQYFYKGVTVEDGGQLQIACASQYFYGPLASAASVKVIDKAASNILFGDTTRDVSAAWPAGGMVATKEGTAAINLYLQPNELGMTVAGPVDLANGTAQRWMCAQQNTSWGLIKLWGAYNLSSVLAGVNAYWAAMSLQPGATLTTRQVNIKGVVGKETYLAVDGGTLKVEGQNIVSSTLAYAYDAHLRLNTGKLEFAGPLTYYHGFDAGFYGPAETDTPFEWNIGTTAQNPWWALAGTGAVRFTGGADVDFSGEHELGILAGPWTIENTGANRLTSAAAFAGGLELAPGVSATVKLGSATYGEGYVNAFITAGSGERETTLGARKDLVLPHLADSLYWINGRGFSDGLYNASAAVYEGEFYVTAELAGEKWTFAGAFDDYLAMYVDGAQVFASAQCAVGTGTTAAAMTEGWHTFRVVAYDISGNDGPTDSWKTCGKGLGYHVGETYSTAPADYAKFDTDTLRMRPVEHHGVLWQRCANTSSAAADRTWATTCAWTNSVVTNAFSFVHTKTVYNTFSTAVNRFSGWFYVPAEKAGLWHFWGNFDDNCMIAIDNVDAGFNGTTGHFDATTDFTLAEGWHRFEFRTRDISGGYGPWTGSEAIKVQVNGGDWTLFDERSFDFMPTHPELHDVRAKVGTLGGVVKLGADSTLLNTAVHPAHITGTLMGSGTLSGAFDFVGTNNCWAVAGDGRHRAVEHKVAFDVSNANALAGLTRIQADFTYRPGCATYELGPALGLVSGEGIAVTVKDAEGNDYSENFTAAVQNGRLVLRNARPTGIAILLR